MAQAATEHIEIRPQSGPQEMFLATPADIAIYGGQAGGGKSYALLMEPLRHIHIKGFHSVIFRRTHPQIKNPGGLWDTSQELYPYLGGVPRDGHLDWTFPHHFRNRIEFAHMQHMKDRRNWQGAQIPFIGFDELSHFEWKQFNYMIGRNRSLCGIRPYIRATCNPDPDSFLRDMLDWWIDNDSGLPIKDRAGKIRFFIVVEDEIIFGDSKKELRKKHGKEFRPLSLTFIPASVYDNKILLKQNPEYLAKLMALAKVDRERLLFGNWNAREAAGMFFQKEWFPVVGAAPSGVMEIRYWDRAATEKTPTNDPAWTAGVKMRKCGNDSFSIVDVIRFRGTPDKVQRMIKNTASQDGYSCVVGIEQDPGQAGKAEAMSQVKNLAGFKVMVNVVRESKATRAKPLSAQVEAGNVTLVRGEWNNGFIQEAENFDGTGKAKCDRVDAASGAFFCLTKRKIASVW